jgi:hypothetical protein
LPACYLNKIGANIQTCQVIHLNSSNSLDFCLVISIS